uniref:Transmembrane protein n=1 Tax=Alexandrium catenella TaxID=2925 RepID=A0A7S1M8E3_ALECA|mmetsp:Transcript_20432/g.55740  ORF Transcript_20432/g.55740 Transcript_20432/m.55740 type:complete len:343 (+) Transcript_20432:88-1116(+)
MAEPRRDAEEPHYVATVSTTTPLFLKFQPSYNEEARAALPEPPPKAKHFKGYHGVSLDIAKALINLFLPPMVFVYVSTLLCSTVHLRFPRFVWLLAPLGLGPAALAGVFLRLAKRRGLSTRWHALSIVLLVAAFLSAAVFGERVYWFSFHPFNVLEGMKTYSNIDPSEVTGVRLMDAGQIHFTEDTLVATDMGMSFTTSWDVYCVAPITTPAGLPSQGSSLTTYDIWAVGMNCCKSAEANFRCGEHDNMKAQAGLRQIGDEERRFYRLAVQQAEAAYGIQAPNPVFFHWVHDPQMQESLFFEVGMENWVLANSVHFVVNLAALVSFVMLFHKPPANDGLPAL